MNERQVKLNKSKIYYVLKVILSIFVVFCHSWGDSITYSVYWKPASFFSLSTKFINSFYMPCFMMVSGMVYGYCIYEQNKYKNIIRFISTKIKRLLIPAILTGVIFTIPMQIFAGENRMPFLTNWRLSSINLVTGSYGIHLWFIFVLFNINIIFRVFNKLIIRLNKKVCSITILSLLLFGMSVFATKFSNSLPWYFYFSLTCQYMFFFYFGIIFNRYIETWLQYITTFQIYMYIALCGILLTADTISGNYLMSKILALIISILFIALVSKLNTQHESFILKVLIKNSMGIYLFQYIPIYISFMFFYNKVHLNDLYIVLTFSFSLLITILITEFFRKIKLSFLIGE